MSKTRVKKFSSDSMGPASGLYGVVGDDSLSGCLLRLANRVLMLSNVEMMNKNWSKMIKKNQIVSESMLKRIKID